MPKSEIVHKLLGTRPWVEIGEHHDDDSVTVFGCLRETMTAYRLTRLLLLTILAAI